MTPVEVKELWYQGARVSTECHADVALEMLNDEKYKTSLGDAPRDTNQEEDSDDDDGDEFLNNLVSSLCSSRLRIEIRL
ncbi:hypothetical protein ACHAWO_007406 [Cyclotella atomus]|uniref:Uncharacterized protein n=1 Tax=Cyclotella atomus TaxID=382360 RepID=A0ABD3PMF0_9STRA